MDPRHLTKEQQDAICEAYIEGSVTSMDLARRHGINQKTVLRALVNRGIPRRAPHQRRMSVTPEQERDFVRRYQRGDNCPQIARDAGLNAEWVRLLLKEHGVVIRQQKMLPQDVIDQLCDRYVSGEPTGRLAKEHDTTITSIGRWLKKRGIPRRPQEEAQRAYFSDPEHMQRMREIQKKAHSRFDRRVAVSCRMRKIAIEEWDGFTTVGRMKEESHCAVARWRAEVRWRDEWVCQMGCGRHGREGRLEAHHIYSWANCPERRLDVGNGITLCTWCHDVIDKAPEVYVEGFERRVRENRARQEAKGGLRMVRRPESRVTQATKERLLERDGWKCVRCGMVLGKSTVRIDHIKTGYGWDGSSGDSNRRCLCRRCFALRAESRRNSEIGRCLRDGLIPPDWRPLVWDDNELK